MEIVQPLGLLVVLGGEHTSVEEDEDYNYPEHCLALDSLPTGPGRKKKS